MKILLVLPFSNSFLLAPDLGLGYLSSSLLKKGLDVTVLDCVLRKMDPDSFESYIKKLKPDVVGFKVFSKDINFTKQAIEKIKCLSKEIHVIVGGPHVSGVKEQVFQHIPGIDFGIAGEGEKSIALLMDFFRTRNEDLLNEIPGLIRMNSNNGKIMCNPLSFEKDIDLYDFPDWKGLAPQEYPPAPHCSFAENFPIAPIIATRGCPYDCTFCSVQNTFARSLRFRSVDSIKKEISLLHNDFGIKEIHFEDDNFTCKKSFAMQVCQKIIDSGMKFTWSCPNGVRLDRLDEELLHVMQASGCYSFAVGIESGSQRILDDMKKEISLEMIKEKVSMIKKFKIKIHGFFIIGYPTEKKEDIWESLKFSRKLNLDTVYFNIFNPFPGTEVFQRLKDEGKLDGFSWDTLFSDKPSLPLTDVSLNELKRLQKIGMLLFYLRPSSFFGLITRFKSLTHFGYIFRRVWNIVVNS